MNGLGHLEARIDSQRRLIGSVLTLLLLCGSLFSANAAEIPRGLRGPPFADGGRTVPMPDRWFQRPIQHDAWADGSELAVLVDSHLFSRVRPWIQKFGRERKMAIAVRAGSCGLAMGMLQKKSVDIGGFCCPPAPGDRLPGLQFHTLGIAPLAILLHPDNPIDDLSTRTVRTIFQGRLTGWHEIPGGKRQAALNDLFIQPITRRHCKTRPGHWRLMLNDAEDFSPDALEVPTTPDMIVQVARYPGAIGYEEVWNIDRFKRRGAVKFIKIDGYSPLDKEALLTGKYPFYRVHNLTSWTNHGVARKSAQRLIRSLLQQSERLDPDGLLISPAQLRRAGWKFTGDELTGEPK